MTAAHALADSVSISNNTRLTPVSTLSSGSPLHVRCQMNVNAFLIPSQRVDTIRNDHTGFELENVTVLQGTASGSSVHSLLLSSWPFRRCTPANRPRSRWFYNLCGCPSFTVSRGNHARRSTQKTRVQRSTFFLI